MIAEGSVLNRRYRVDRQVGRGSFAQVFLSTDLVLLRKVALKVLHPDLGGATEEQDFLMRFMNEARVIAALDHPNILGIYDYGEADGHIYLVMPYIEGGTLHERLRRRQRFGMQEAGEYLRQAAAALDYAHRRQLVHRDIKPHNMLLRSEDDRLLLADFGIAKVLSGASSQTRTAVMGTLAYMAPEQLDGRVSPATDVYALGCVLFQMLTGHVPYSGSTQQVIMAHLVQPIPSLAAYGDEQVAALAQGVIDRALAKQPAERFQTAGGLAAALQAAITQVATEVPDPAVKLREAVPIPRPPTSGAADALPVPHSALNAVSSSSRAAAKVPPWGRWAIPLGALGTILGLLLVVAIVASLIAAPWRQAAPTGTATARATSGIAAEVGSPTVGATRGAATVAVTTGVANTPLVAAPTLATPFGATRTPATPVPSTWASIATLSEHTGYVVCVAWSPDGRTLASGSDDRTVRLWSADGTPLKSLVGHSERVRGLAWSPDGTILASGAQDNTVRLWSADGEELATLHGHTGYVTSVAWSPDGKTLASGSDDGTMRLWSAEGRELLTTFSANTGYVISVAWSPDGKTVAAGAEDRTVRLWSVDGDARPPLSGHAGYVTSVAWSPDGKTLASGSDDRTVRLWSADGRELAVLPGHTDKIWSVAWSPDGKTLASGSVDQTVRLWGADGTPLATLTGHLSYVPSVAWSPDGKTLASASWDKTVRLWRIGG